MKKKPEKTPLTDALFALEKATTEYECAAEEEERARCQATAFLNKLNEVQKEWEILINGLKATAPKGTTWDQSKTKAPPAPANSVMFPALAQSRQAKPGKKVPPVSTVPNPWAKPV